MAKRTLSALPIFAAVIGWGAGCVVDHGDLAVDAGDKGDAAGAVIVGSINWQETTTLAAGSAERANSRAVAYLDIPAEGQRCTGFLIAPDVIMTNEHCIPSQSSASGVTAWFEYEGSLDGGPAFSCGTFIGNDAANDYALLRCEGNPGDTYGVVELEEASPAKNALVYAIHQNCDYYTTPSCAPTKKYSPGKVTSTSGEIGHDADTLGGSSGSPLFSKATHKVIGLHHVGIGNNGSGRGTSNKAVSMRVIKPLLQQRYPGLQLGPRAPVDQGTAPVTGDGYEPNDTANGAVQVQLPFLSSGGAAIESATDSDFFSFQGTGAARVIELRFTHSVGDLDIYVFDAAGTQLARSIGTTDVERVERTFPSGTITVRVVGYQGALGGYTLDIH